MRPLGLALVGLVVLALAAAAATATDPFQELNLIRPAKPMPAPDFTVPGLDGHPISLRDLRGQVVFLNFWATWCPPCKEEMPSMERLWQRFRGRGLALVAISIDHADAARVREFAASLRLTFPVGLDPKLEVANRYTLRALPTSVLVDRAGHVVALALGPRDWDGRAARAVIEELLAR